MKEAFEVYAVEGNKLMHSAKTNFSIDCKSLLEAKAGKSNSAMEAFSRIGLGIEFFTAYNYSVSVFCAFTAVKTEVKIKFERLTEGSPHYTFGIELTDHNEITLMDELVAWANSTYESITALERRTLAYVPHKQVE